MPFSMKLNQRDGIHLSELNMHMSRSNSAAYFSARQVRQLIKFLSACVRADDGHGHSEHIMILS